MKPGDKFYNEIAWMHRSGLSTGVKQPSGKSNYAPKTTVSREAIAAFIYRLEHAKTKAPQTSPFVDVKPGDKFYKEIAWMSKEGLSTGLKQSKGKPKYAPRPRYLAKRWLRSSTGSRLGRRKIGGYTGRVTNSGRFA